LESDTGLTYNPNSGLMTTTGFAGALTGNADTATALATPVNVGGVSFDGTADIDLPGVNAGGNQNTSGTATIATTVTVADESSDTSCHVLYTTAATGDLGPKSGTNLTFNSSSGLLTATGFAGNLTGDTGVLGNIYMGGIPASAGSVAVGAATIVCFKTTSTLSAGHAVEITADMTVGPYTSGSNDSCVGIALADADGSMAAAVVQVQISGVMKVASGISEFGIAVVAGQMCTCGASTAGVITSQGQTAATDATDFVIVKSGTSDAYVMWVKGSVF